MKFLLNEKLKIICQGLTGKSGTYHISISMKYGTEMVGGVTPGKGGSIHLGLPVFNTVKEAVYKTKANTSIIFVPAIFCKDSIIEAAESGIKLIICVTEGIPILDMIYIKKIIKEKNIILVGPNSPGFVIPNICRAGIMPVNIHRPGVVGIVSRSGTLTYEAILQTTDYGLGQSLSIGIGGDPIIGVNFCDMLKYFESDNKTKIILMIGEIGGKSEEIASNFIKKFISKPVLAYIAGINAPVGKRMGHAGAIISENSGSAESKIKHLKFNGIKIIESLPEIGKLINIEYKRFYNIL